MADTLYIFQNIRYSSDLAAQVTFDEGTIVADTTTKTLAYHDGLTPGGFPLACADMNNVSVSALSNAGALTNDLSGLSRAVATAKFATFGIYQSDMSDAPQSVKDNFFTNTGAAKKSEVGTFDVGDMCFTLSNTASNGWILYDSTKYLGAPGSYADYTAAPHKALYTLWWNTFTDELAPLFIWQTDKFVEVPRGTSADADWEAKRVIKMPDVYLNHVMAVASSTHVLGSAAGVEEDYIAVEEIPQHTHDGCSGTVAVGSSNAIPANYGSISPSGGITGWKDAEKKKLSRMQPTVFFNLKIFIGG
jgi:hypothetical protein